MSRHRLKIMSPIDRPEEALPLIKAGADEFFCGVLVNGENLGSMRKNESRIREFNFPDFETLREAVAVIKKNKKKIYIAFNSPVLGPRRKLIIANNIEKIKSWGIDGLIFADMESIETYRNSGLKIIASSFLEVKNRETVKLLERAGASRIIFDRQITLEELKMTRSFPGLEFEAFIMNSACRSLACHCFYNTLAKEDKFWRESAPGHLCLYDSFIINSGNGKRLDIKSKRIIAQRLKTPNLYLPPLYQLPSCGACALFHFRRYPIHSLKVVGRGFETAMKVKAVKMIKAARDILKKNYRKEKFYKKTMELFEKTFGHPCQKRFCFYPHFLN